MSTLELQKDDLPDEVFAKSTAILLPELATTAINYQRWAAQNLVAASDMVSGLAASNALALKSYIDKQLEILNDPVAALEGLEPEVAAAIINSASDGFIKASDILRRQALDSVKAAEVMMKVKGKSSKGNGGPQKPGFAKKSRAQPVAIQAQPGSTVTVNTSNPEEKDDE